VPLVPHTRGNAPINGTAQYRLTPLSRSVRELADLTAPGFGDAIRKEKAVRKLKQQGRERVLNSK